MILGYHGVAREPRSLDLFRLQLPPEEFRAQLEMLLAAGFEFVTVAELARRANGGTPPPGLAVVSFDDGMENNYTRALPILGELGLPATIYVPTGWLGGTSPYIGEGGDGRILTEVQLQALAGAGWELGGHTVNHADMSRLGYEECLREVVDNCEQLGRIGGRPVETFAYPFGYYGQEAIRAVQYAGLRAAVTTGTGRWDPFELTRAMVSSGDPFSLVLLKLADRYEPLLRNAPMRGVRRASKTLRAAANRRGRSDADERP